MIDPTTLLTCFDELQKEAAIKGKHLLGAGLVAGGAVAGAKGKDALQDRNEGRVHRLQREMQQRQMLQAMKQRQGSQGGY